MEFALVLTPLLLVIAGIINFGVVFAQQLALDNAARQAARSAVVDEQTRTGIEAEMEVALESMINKQGPVAVSISGPGADKPCESSALGQDVTVTAEYTADFVFPWLLPGIPDSVDLTGKGVFQCEFS